MSVVDEIFTLFQERGAETYLGESVSLTQHMLQAAHAAERDGADDVLIAAALLHDIGHFLHDQDEDCAQHGIDSRHEDAAAEWLDAHFQRELTKPVQMHVAAKRYLCAVEPEYRRQLSPASIHSLNLQGGPMSADEVRQFENRPCFREAVKLRRWDEMAKDPESPTPPLEHYRPVVEAALKQPAGDNA